MIVFIDESGDHNLEAAKLDNYYNIFVLGAVCFSEEAYAVFDTELRSLKRRFFWEDDYVLHTRDITRTKNAVDSRTSLFSNPLFRRDFYTDMNALIEQSDFRFIACLINKSELCEKYVHPTDPYILSLENIINRTVRHLSVDERVNMYPEHRDAVENRKLELEMLRLKIIGTRFYSGAMISESIRDFRLVKKQENLSGSQLVDMLVTPLGRHHIGKPPRPGHEVDYQVVKRKFARITDFTIFP